MHNRETIIINTTVNAPIENVWKYFNELVGGVPAKIIREIETDN